MKDNVGRPKQTQCLDSEKIGISRARPYETNSPFFHVDLADWGLLQIRRVPVSRMSQGAKYEPCARMLTLTHVRVGVKEPIQCIETLDGVSPIRQ